MQYRKLMKLQLENPAGTNLVRSYGPGQLRIANVYMKHGDGFEGWAAYAPFDGIIVAAASYAVPPALLEQLAEGGRLVIPVGNDREQQLLRITRRGDRYEREVLEPVIFVPLLQGLA